MTALSQRAGEIEGVVGQSAAAKSLDLEYPHLATRSAVANRDRSSTPLGSTAGSYHRRGRCRKESRSIDWNRFSTRSQIRPMTTRQPNDRTALLEQAIRRKRAAAGSDTPTMMPRPADQPACLSDIQRGLWLLHQMDPRSPAYNLTSAFRVEGALDPEKLERALNEVVSRHRILRSTFRRQGETVLQVVHPHSPLALEVVEAEDGEGLAATVGEASKPFDLETGPLIRLQIVEESSQGDSLLAPRLAPHPG